MDANLIARALHLHRLLALAVTLLAGSLVRGADVPDNLVTNGGFEAGMQIWKGDGKIVLLPDGNRVYELEASKTRMKDLKQEFHLRQLQQVEVVFRARSLEYTGPGIRISIHQPGAGSLLWNRELPEDGSWKSYRILYTRTNANYDVRELNIATLLGTGAIQIDDVEVRVPSKMGDDSAPGVADTPPARPMIPPPAATPNPAPKPQPPVAFAKPVPPVATPAPAPQVSSPIAPAAVAPGGGFGSLEQIVKSAPEDSLKKLADSATTEAAMTELNGYLAEHVKGKPVLLPLKVNKSEAMTETRNKFRIGAYDTSVQAGGGAVNVRVWAYFLEPAAPADGKAAHGSAVTVSAIIGRCDFTSKGGLRLNIDLQQSKLEEH